MTDLNRAKGSYRKIALRAIGRKEDIARIEINQEELLELLSNPFPSAILIKEDRDDSEEEREISKSKA